MPHFRRRRYPREKPLVDSSVTLDSHCACAQTVTQVCAKDRRSSYSLIAAFPKKDIETEYLRETSASAPPVGTRIATAPGIANKTCNLEANCR